MWRGRAGPVEGCRPIALCVLLAAGALLTRVPLLTVTWSWSDVGACARRVWSEGRAAAPQPGLPARPSWRGPALPCPLCEGGSVCARGGHSGKVRAADGLCWSPASLQGAVAPW